MGDQSRNKEGSDNDNDSKLEKRNCNKFSSADISKEKLQAQYN